MSITPQNGMPNDTMATTIKKTLPIRIAMHPNAIVIPDEAPIGYWVTALSIRYTHMLGKAKGPRAIGAV